MSGSSATSLAPTNFGVSAESPIPKPKSYVQVRLQSVQRSLSSTSFASSLYGVYCVRLDPFVWLSCTVSMLVSIYCGHNRANIPEPYVST